MYHQQQSPQLHSQQSMRKQQQQQQDQEATASNKPLAVDDENRPPAAGGPGNSGLVWEPRDPPLQYSIIPHQQQQQQTHNHGGGGGGGGVIKSRLEPRRSASLSQADLATYEGKVVLGRLHPHSSQSPPRPPPPQESPASRYQDYYETKYEKPVRRGDTPNVGPGQQQQRGRQLLPGIDVDTIWKSRWRSTSPPPAPVDDWLPIKPPQLAWAKPVQLPPMVELRSSRKTSRIPLPVNPMANPMARSMSGDMDHMIYLERDMPADARLMFRERTRSIDRGLAQHQNQHPHHHHSRMAYKTYEEELADYHGRTGSVDRLATAGTNRGRPRTIRMGTQSHQVGRSVPASLERRHNEDRSASSSRRRPESGDSSNSSGTRQQSSSRRGSNSTADISNSTNESSGGKSASRSNNVNRVYIDGQHQELLEPVVLRNPSSSAIRVTMTDTRSLKRPTNNNRNSGSSPGHSQPMNESSTMPRMSKRHGLVQSGPSQRVTGVVQPQYHHHHHHPGTTTVYLAQDQEQQVQSPVRHHTIEVDPQHSIYRNNKATTKRIKTDADGQGNHIESTFIHHHHHHHHAVHSQLPLLFFHLSPIQQTVL